MRGTGTLVAAITLAACYDPSLGPCAVTCEVGDVCPGALTCETDGFCHAPGEGPTCTPDAAIEPDAAVGDGFVMLAAGSRHTCGIDADGALSCWGLNTRAQVDPSTDRRTGTPTAVDGAAWERIDGGTNATCGIQQHQLWCWGANDSAQAGQPVSTPTVTVPTRIDPGGEADFLELSLSSTHGCAIRGFAQQRMYCWGSDAADQLGRGPGDDSGETLGEVEGGFTDWLLVAAGERHSCGVRQNGDAYCWGDGTHGELGTNDTSSYAVPTEVDTSQAFRSIAAGRNFTCGISTNGFLFCWGDNSNRQLGIDGIGSADTPSQVGTTMGWTGIATLFRGGCGILMGRVQCWGGGADGEIGNGAWVDEAEPTPVTGLMNVSYLAAGDYHACAIAGGVTSCWGLDGDGQLGTGTFATKYVPTQIDASGWDAIAAGELHTCGIDDGALYCWGQNDQLALGVTAPAQSPTPVRIGSDVGWKAVGVGTRFGCALREASPDDELWCWGDDTYGQLGNGTAVTGARPAAQVANPGAVSQWDLLVVGPHAACATSGASRWCWGEGAEGQLGNAGTAQLDEPTQVPSETLTWSHLTMGYHFGVGLAGTHLYTWGRNAESQLGNASTVMQLSPIDLGLNGWSDVTAAFNGNHACAIGNGSVACWGNNTAGKLGNGNTSGQSVPTAVIDVPMPQAYTTLRAGAEHTCAVHQNGLYCWGDASLSQLGDESLTPYSDEPALITATGFERLATGKSHSCGVTAAGALFCWGDNVHGVIGDGTEAKASPVPTLPPPGAR